MSRRFRTAIFAALATAMSAAPWAAQASPLPLDPGRIFAGDRGLIAIASPAHLRASVGAVLFGAQISPDTSLSLPGANQASASIVVNFAIPPRDNAPQTLIAITPSVPLYADDTPLLPSPPEIAVSRGAATVEIATPPAPVRFGAYLPYVPTLEAVSGSVSTPVRIAGVRFTAQAIGSGMQTLHPDAFHALQVCGTTDQAAPCPYLVDSRASSWNLQTNFMLRAGNEELGLQINGGIERASVGQSAVFPYVPVNPDLQPGTAVSVFDPQAPLLYYPGLTSVSKQTLGATLAVPVTPRITVGLQYQRQRYQGGYGSLLFPGLDANKDTYLGNLTYQLPFSSSAITLSARQYRYQDLLSPGYNLTQTRADLNFTVKF